jgi:8-oxo-dGTP diphosphatase
VEQLYTQTGSNAEGGEPVLEVAYLLLTLRESQTGGEANGTWRTMSLLPALAVEDVTLLNRARRRLRERAADPLMPAALLPPEFALSDLQQVQEAVLGRELDKRNFRKWVLASGAVEATAHFRRDGAHRPARLYRFRTEANADGTPFT